MQRRADNHLDESVLGGLRHRDGADELAVAEDRGAVGEPCHLVEPVRHVDDRDTGSAQAVNGIEEQVDVVSRQRRGGLVEHDHSRFRGHRACHSDECTLCGLEAIDRRRRVDVDLPALEKLPCKLALAAPRDQPVRRAKARDVRDVLGDREAVQEAQVLMHERESVRSRLARADPVRKDVPAETDRARGRAVDAGKDLDQRALARAVLAEQSKYFTAPNGEIDAAEGPGAAEAAREPFDGQSVLVGRSGRLGSRSGGDYFTPQSFSHADLKSYEFAIAGPLVEPALVLSIRRNGTLYFTCGL